MGRWGGVAAVLVLVGVLAALGYARSLPGAAPLPAEDFTVAPAEVADPSSRPPTGLDGDRLVIPSLEVAAPLDRARVVEGRLELPERIEHVALWDGSAPVGAARGALLVAGHVDDPGRDPGALRGLATLQPGAAVHLVHGGRATTWKVVGLSASAKAELPSEVWNGPRGPRRLYVVTCGGPVVDGHYRDNVVVEAVPVGVR